MQKKWDYLTVVADHNFKGRPEQSRASDGRTFSRGEAFMQQLGEEGWELVAVVFGTSGHDEYGNPLNYINRFYFKRPRPCD
ncbi:MAG: hypothetical protein AAB332_02645 [Planctomycetota bacterium]